MYKSLALLLALVALSTGSGYIKGRDYVYRYHGYVYSGYSDRKPQYAGLAFDTSLIVQPHSDHWVIQLIDPKYDVINQEVEDFTAHDYNYHELPPAGNYLKNPFRIFFKHGLVDHFEVPKNEPTFSVNAKRAVLSLFHLNFDETEAGGVSDKDNEVHKPEEVAHYYTVTEDGVLGDCETAYVIEHQPADPQNNIVLNVTKSRNYHKCTHIPNHHYSTFYGHECGHNDYEKSHTLHGNAHFYYNIRGDRHHYVIEHVHSEGEVIYVPYPLEGQPADLYTNRTLELVEERDVHHDIKVEGETDRYDNLKYEIPFRHHFKDEIDLKQPHYLYHIYGKKAPVEQIKRLAEELVRVYDDDSYKQKTKDTNYPALFLELVRAFGTLGYDDIDDIYHKYADFPKDQATAEKMRYRNLFFDALINTGTNPAILYVKNLIHDNKVSHHLALYFIQQIQHHVKEVSEKLLDAIEELCEDSFVKEDATSYAACYSTLSNVIYENCGAHYHPESGFPEDEYDCPEDIPVKYFNHIVDKYEHTDVEYLKVAYLKAIGNIGIKESVPLLRPHVEGQIHEVDYVRSTAIWALKNVGYKYKDQVKEILVPLYFNRSENYEFRIAAFTSLMKFHPETYELETIARSLLREEDDQIRSFVYSYFQSYVNSTHPCDRQLTEDVRYALHALRYHEHEFDKYDYSYSHHHYFAGYDHDYDFGGHTRFAYLASDTGYIPRTVFLGLNDYLGGKSYDAFGIGFKQYGLEKFFDKLFGPEGAYGKRSFFDLFKKREKREISNVEKERKEIQEKLHLETKEYEPIHGEIFFKYMGNHLSFLYFNESTFEDFFKQGAFNIPNLAAKYKHLPEFNYQRFLLAVDKLYYIPSESGLPIIFDYKQPIYYYHKNNKLDFEVKPAFFKGDRDNQPPTELDVKIDGHFVFDKNLFASLGFLAPYQESIIGLGINRRCTLSLPVKLELEIDLKETKYHVHWHPVVPHEVYHFHYEPYTFIDSYKNYVPVVDESTYLPVRLEGHRKRYYKKLFHDELGVGFKAYKDYDNEWNDFGSWFHFLTSKDYREKFYYLYANPHFEPYHYDLVLEAADHDATTEVEANFSYDFSFDDGERQEQAHEGHDFEEYSHAKDHHKFLTCALKAEIVAKGEKERKLDAELLYSRDITRRHHKISLYYDRTPWARYENDHFKVCVSGYLNYPDLDLKKVAMLDTVDMDRHVEGKMKIHFGKDCSTASKITIQSKFDQTEEQKDLERRREEPDTVEHYNPYSHLYHDCLNDKAHGEHYPRSCIDYMYLSVDLHKYTHHIKYEHLTPEFLNRTYKVGRFFKHLLYEHGDHNVIDVSHPEDEVHFEANFSAIYPVTDIRVIKPHSESHYTHVHSPCYHPFKAYNKFEDIRTKKSANEHYCLIESDHVFTFDQFKYDLPPIDCYKVISKDCSPNQHFIVLASKITHPKYKKAIKVILGNHKVEVLPVSDESKLIVRVDGKKVPVTEEEPYYHYDEGHKIPDFYLTYRNNFFYALHSEKYGLIVEYDGEFISVQVSPFYRNKLCGLCGNYNGQSHDGYINHKGCVIHDADSYAYSFTLQTDTCHVPEVKEDCHGEGSAGCSELKTHVLQLNTGKIPQTCFSTEPVPQCANGCTESGHVKLNVGFHCLPAKDDSTKKLLRQQQTRVLHEIRRKSRDHEEEIEVPEGCHRS